MGKFSDYEYRKQPGFDMNAFEGANQAIPMTTLVIHYAEEVIPYLRDINQPVAVPNGVHEGATGVAPP